MSHNALQLCLVAVEQRTKVKQTTKLPTSNPWNIPRPLNINDIMRSYLSGTLFAPFGKQCARQVATHCAPDLKPKVKRTGGWGLNSLRVASLVWCERLSWTAAYLFFRKPSSEIPACFRIARRVPSGMSPGWLGMVVYRFVCSLYQISWLPAAWRSNTKPNFFNRLIIWR